jgi:hypothetical protein
MIRRARSGRGAGVMGSGGKFFDHMKFKQGVWFATDDVKKNAQ